jgi:uncharacterized protein (DUF302 family)
MITAIEVTVASDLAATEAAVRAELAAEGFGVLTEADVAATLRAELDVDRPPLEILGAGDPVLANRALEIDPSVALLLPRDVVLESVDGDTRVQIVDPLELLDDARYAALAEEARARLRGVADRLACGDDS